MGNKLDCNQDGERERERERERPIDYMIRGLKILRLESMQEEKEYMS